jgi:hypothetical protein
LKGNPCRTVSSAVNCDTRESNFKELQLKLGPNKPA